MGLPPRLRGEPHARLFGDPEQEYFVDGMVEDIITGLSRIKWLIVIARNSSFTYKGKAVDVRQVGRELGVRYVLEGGVPGSARRRTDRGDPAGRRHLVLAGREKPMTRGSKLAEQVSQSRRLCALRDGGKNCTFDCLVMADGGPAPQPPLERTLIQETRLSDQSSWTTSSLKFSPFLTSSRLGDIYVLGPHRLICGSSIDPKTFTKLMAGDPPARFVFTHEPYNVPIAGHVSGTGHREFAMASGEMSDAEFTAAGG